jgi:hypothetical protein
MFLLSALMFAFGMNGEALAKDKKEKKKAPQTEAEKQAGKEKAQQHKEKQQDAQDNSGGSLKRLHASSHGKSDSNWLHDGGSKY